MTSIDANLIVESEHSEQMKTDNANGGFTGLKWFVVITIIFSFNTYSIQVVGESEMLNRAPLIWTEHFIALLLLVVGVLVSTSFFVNASKFINTVIIWACSGFVFQTWRLIYLDGFTPFGDRYDLLFFSIWLPLLLWGFLLYLSLIKYRTHHQENNKKE